MDTNNYLIYVGIICTPHQVHNHADLKYIRLLNLNYPA